MEIIFGPEEAHGVPKMCQKSLEATTRVGGVPYLPGCAPTSWPPQGPPDLFPMPKPLIYTQTPRNKPRSGVPPPQASVATENQSRPVPAPCRRGGISLRWPSSSSRRSPWRGGSSSPSGLRVCTSSYVFDLSLSLVFWRWYDLDVPRALLLYLDHMMFSLPSTLL